MDRGQLRNEKCILAYHKTTEQVFSNFFCNKDLLLNKTLSAYIKKRICHGTIRYQVDDKS